jgi:PilZ domain
VHSPRGDDRRKQPRHDYVSTVRYSPHPEAGGQELDGYTLNMSGAGLCLSVGRSLKVGQEIVITKCILTALLRRYTVRWVRQSEKHHATTYLAGVMSSGGAGH